MEVKFENAFKNVTPSLHIIRSPLRLTDFIDTICTKEDSILFTNINGYFWLCYPNTLNVSQFRKITGKITVHNLAMLIYESYEELLRFSSTNIRDIIISDILCDYTKKIIYVVI